MSFINEIIFFFLMYNLGLTHEHGIEYVYMG